MKSTGYSSASVRLEPAVFPANERDASYLGPFAKEGTELDVWDAITRSIRICMGRNNPQRRRYMKRNLIAGFAMAVGLLSLNPFPASAAETGKCLDKVAMQQFAQETAPLVSSLKAKELEFGKQYAYEGAGLIDVSQLQAEIKELKSQIKTAAKQKGLEPCCES
jgi:hypothetical protein